MAKTVEEVLAEIDAKQRAEIQEALDFEASGKGVAEFVLGVNKRPREEIEQQIKEAEMQPSAMLEKLKSLEAEIASIKGGAGTITPTK